ncbi:MAG: branched-chain amino acid ABC transporter permease [Actinobacteria bacterium]|nr:MAG: branched-chain amino acid ABC transporter permease [Actinomycetota bacterium]
MATTTVAPTRSFKFSWTDSFLWAIRVMAIFIIVWGFVGTIALGLEGNGLSLEAWKQLLVAGVANGSMYGLLALGYSMVYGVLGFINFAHGEVFMVGAIVGFYTANALFDAGFWESNFILSIIIVLVVAVVSSTSTAVLIEKIAYRPLRDAPRLIPLITSIGISFFIQNAVALLVGPAVKTYPAVPTWLSDPINVLGFDIPGTVLLVLVLALISMVGLWLFVERSATGRAMRAVAEDKEIAALMGINVDRVIVTTFAVGGMMAGVAALLWALMFRGVSFFIGFLPGIKAFTAAVLGGIGNIVGAMFGGILLGLFEGLGPNIVLRGLSWQIPTALAVVLLVVGSATVLGGRSIRRKGIVVLGAAAIVMGIAGVTGFTIVIPGLSQLKDVVAFTALILVLIFKPAGLFGERLAKEDRA